MTTIFEKFKYVFMDFMGKDFTISDVLDYAQKRDIYIGYKSLKNKMYQFSKIGYLEKITEGKGWTPAIWRVSPAFKDAIDMDDYFEKQKEAREKEKLKDKQVIYINKYDQLTRDYELIEPAQGRKIMETMEHSHDRQKSPRVYVGNLWEMMV